MCRNGAKLILAWLLMAAGGTAAIAADSLPLAKPQVPYSSKNRRDPFVQPQAGRLRNVMTQVDIEVLKLTGLIRSSQTASALFTSQNGPGFGYLLRDGRLFSENYQPVPGITGEIVSMNEVVLRQDGRQIRYQLRDR